MADNKKQEVSAKQLFPLIIEELERGRSVQFTVSGSSMMPWIVNNRDSVNLISAKNIELKKGDIILFEPFKDTYVLHRIMSVRPEGYMTIGDGNLYPDGYTSRESVIAKVISISRKDKKIDCESVKWKVIFRIWMFLRPVRKYLLKGLGYLGGLKKKCSFDSNN